ncbi:twin-arginine translocation pathway signal protein [Pseudomonas sp. S 311-6]|uniref:twin-arginine translocation pathway signal protein n=1 Tax=Pseudomonas TaxID=286 RepID=UPI001CE3C0DB|nr:MULTISPECIES: twin-arginine translocation pathway signal protein [Pseudomonas]MCO7636118.1 twin-arginine translocation pathway signal protein [Pseudomonas sp. S 311-6]MCO7563462.1 twin-arginine translocation pathway signal protein [Pseudomonas mosselii]MCO7594662.1 twin-arginine translocation pathway signal protein [Pseudomonas guariconensis]MCO7614895.1 twin-arginine translocation pathway signal protein [Pseudomonas guariconensis]MCO7615156.1 twin-arginine translocation pathway signal prot
MHRRDLLQFSLGASVFLAGASLVGCSPQASAPGFSTLRDDDLPLLHALIPVVLAGTQASPTLVLHSLDHKLAALSPAMLKLTRQLFDVLNLPLTRGPLTGVWGRWENASPAQVSAFLARWQDSSLNLLRMGHASLLQLLLMAWYERPEAWAACGYPGPPNI